MNSQTLTHLAIIMDGNGRWAKFRNKPLIEGYHEGVNALKNVIKSCLELKIKYLTVFAFSSENWNRNNEEIEMLMHLIQYYVQEELPNLINQEIKLNVIGERENLTTDIQEMINNAEFKTVNNQKLNLTIALNYGSQQEIVRATKKIANEVLKGKVNIKDIDVQYFNNFLYTTALPDLDLLIRTSGEIRLSNFLLWQASYAELYFTNTLWPDFGYNELMEAIKCYKKRDRRYGKSNAKEIESI